MLLVIVVCWLRSLVLPPSFILLRWTWRRRRWRQLMPWFLLFVFFSLSQFTWNGRLLVLSCNKSRCSHLRSTCSKCASKWLRYLYNVQPVNRWFCGTRHTWRTNLRFRFLFSHSLLLCVSAEFNRTYIMVLIPGNAYCLIHRLQTTRLVSLSVVFFHFFSHLSTLVPRNV